MLLETTQAQLEELIARELHRLTPDAEIEGKMTKDDFMVVADKLSEPSRLDNVDDLDDIAEIFDDEDIQIYEITHLAKILASKLAKELK